jgi:transcription-repair coupling factor (superfamily II helicase)
MSSFLSTEQRATIQGLRDGSIDIVISTHPDYGRCRVQNLGLVVIDGNNNVKHKERFKEHFLIDVLAFPPPPFREPSICRSGAKDMSVIETPPPNRLPVETVICGYANGSFAT